MLQIPKIGPGWLLFGLINHKINPMLWAEKSLFKQITLQKVCFSPVLKLPELTLDKSSVTFARSCSVIKQASGLNSGHENGIIFYLKPYLALLLALLLNIMRRYEGEKTFGEEG